MEQNVSSNPRGRFRLLHYNKRIFTPADFHQPIIHRTGRISRQAELEGKTDWVAQFQKSGEETKRAEKKVWQDSFWEQFIYSDKFMRQKLNYIHMNPVRAGFVDEPGKYPYSSYRNYEFDDNMLIEIDKDWI